MRNRTVVAGQALLLCLAGIAILLPGLPVVADQPSSDDPNRLTVQRIFSSNEFRSESYGLRWLPSGDAYLRWESSKDAAGGQDLVVYDADSGERRVLVSAAHLIPANDDQPLSIDNYQLSRDQSMLLIYTNSKRVWRQNTRGDYWVLDRAGRQLWQLGGEEARASSLMFAKFSPDGQNVAYVRERQIYVESLSNHSIRCLTSGSAPHLINGTFDWVYEEELGLRDGFRWSPDSTKIAYWQLDTRGVSEFPLINHTDSLYPQVTWIPYPKVGQRNSSSRVGVVDLKSSRTTWMPVPGDPRNHYLARLQWAGNSEELLIQQLNRRQNENHLWLVSSDGRQQRTILVEQDEAWVDVHDELIWFDDHQQFTWISDRDGWRHVYAVNREGQVRRLTPGEFDVIQLLAVDEQHQRIYFIASPENATQRFLFRANLDGSGLQQVTPAAAQGVHQYSIAPGSRFAVHTSSRFAQPSSSELIRLDQHQPLRTLAANRKLRRRLRKLNLPKPEFWKIDLGGEVVLDAWCLLPPELDRDKKYPLFIHVYGEPVGSTVVDRWGGSRYLWHAMLAQQGYVVVSIDNRGTAAPRGREFRKFAFRKIGIVAPSDQAAAVKRLQQMHTFIDRERTGVWGWSGGGSMSLNAIFKYPDLYQTAIAVASVPNQRYYDTIYQERYMGLPGDNVDGFREGSPINYAHQLTGNLLIIHGTGDDNCHYQTFEMLVNELIRHNKPFSMMAYPNRTHSIREGKNTTRHLYELMTSYLKSHLPAGPR